jgi:hypothetical protein
MLQSINHNKFSLVEMTSNSKGKTSPGLVCGVAMVATACIGFLWSIATHFDGGVMGSGAFAMAGTSLLAVRRFTPDKPIDFSTQKNSINEQ